MPKLRSQVTKQPQGGNSNKMQGQSWPAGPFWRNVARPRAQGSPGGNENHTFHKWGLSGHRKGYSVHFHLAESFEVNPLEAYTGHLGLRK